MKYIITSCQLTTVGLIVLFIFYILSDYNEYKVKESFWTSPGTLIQLESSHAPTGRDLVEMLKERNRV